MLTQKLDILRILAVGALLAGLIAVAGCAASASPAGGTSLVPAVAANGARALPHVRGTGRTVGANPIQHIVVIVQENRTIDNLFQRFPGARTQPYAFIGGNKHNLVEQGIAVPFDPAHSHNPAFVTEFDGGLSDGWLSETFRCKGGAPMCAADGATALAYVNPTSARPYYDIGNQFILADEVFQANEGPSFPAHQYLIAAQSGGAQPNSTWGFAENGRQGGNYECGSSAAIERMDMTSQYPGTEGNAEPPCGNYQTLLDELDAAGISWKYYAHSKSNLWAAPNSVKHLHDNDGAKVISPETTVLHDIANCSLPQVAYVTPSFRNSDHPMGTSADSPYWPASIINAIGNQHSLACNYWSNTVVLVTWDDWGGWFDHEIPWHPGFDRTDPYEAGYRTPLLIVSAYDQPQAIPYPHVDHTQRTNMSILHFIEDRFGLPQLTHLDAGTDDLGTDFCLQCMPRSFVPIDMKGHHFAASRDSAEPDGDIDG